MHSTVWAVNVLDPQSLISAFGTLGVVAIIFAETGLLIGFFLPGDSLLFTAGVFAATSAEQTLHLPLGWLLVLTPLAAILGAETGYLIGAKTGPRLFRRPDSRLFRQEYVDRAEEYFTRFGPAKAVLIARFVPIVRTFLNPVAGALGMPRRTFTVWNAVGGVVWTVGVILLGYWLGSRISNVDHYLLPIVGAVIVLSVVPIVLEVLRTRRAGSSR